MEKRLFLSHVSCLISTLEPKFPSPGRAPGTGLTPLSQWTSPTGIPAHFVLLNSSHLTVYALGTLMSPTTNMALRTVQWSTGRRCPRGCTSGTTIFVLHPNMEMIGLSFPFVRGLWNEQMLNTGSVFTLLPWQNIDCVIINSQTVCLYIWFKIILFHWGFRS